ncbi:MAG TPA: phospholipase D-like domain-containing protein [Burkholderiales bacterium]|nr:phospholipase D-like domain-containing protein [Burkholderiales bacterium]
MAFDSLAGLLSAAAVVVVVVLFFLLLFEPGLPYRFTRPQSANDSREFVDFLSAIVNARLFSAGEVDVLNSGAAIYAAELAAIRGAKRSIHLEAYLFLRGKIAGEVLAALIERARADVAVRLVLDRIGSFATPNRYFAELRAAGGKVYWYQPIAWYTLKRFNNRTHRDILVVDAEVAFVGGAGVADYWIGPVADGAPWRDTMIRVTGGLVRGLQTAFAEHWLEASGEILPEKEFALSDPRGPEVMPPGCGRGMVINSTPSAGRSTRARILFQVLVVSARESIQICSPYFLPDRSLCAELLRAVASGVAVTVLMPGKWNNHPIARLASRRRYGALLRGGVRIFEYQAGMIHAKVLIIDGTWSVLGSTNFDNRSFGLNDEVNVAILERSLAARLQADFADDLAKSRAVSIDEWRRRPLLERVLASLGRLFERQE